VATLVLAGDLPKAAARAEGVEGWADSFQQWNDMTAERGVLRAAERRMAAAESATAAEASRWEDVLSAVRIGLQAAPHAPELTVWIPRVEADAIRREEAGEHAMAARLYEGLSLLDASPEITARRRAKAADLATRLAISERYGPERLKETLASQEGIQVQAALDAMETVHREFIEEVQLGPWMARSRARLALLAADPHARNAFPALSDGSLLSWLSTLEEPDVQELSDAATQIRVLVREASARGGIPEQTTVFEIMDAGLGGLDSWSSVIWPAAIARWNAHHEGVYVGIGLALGVDAAGRVVVEYPHTGSPADEVGIHQGDVLESVGGHTWADQDSASRRQALQASLLGASGEVVEVVLERAGERRVFEVVRRPLTPDVVTGWRRTADNSWSWWLDEEHGIAYVRIVSFKAHTDEAVDDALADLSGVRAVVLDLRSNSGGDVNAAVNVVDRFVAQGTLAQLEGRVAPELGPDVDPESGEPLAPWNAAIPGHPLEGLPVAVLVNRQTASSAELVAGGLQELASADVIGERTHGKGLSQALRVDPDGRYALQFTNLYWTLPSGRTLDQRLTDVPGVMPSVVDVLTPAEQFWVTVEERRRGYVQVHADGTPVVYASTVGRRDLPTLTVDPHVLEARLLLRARLELGGQDAQ